MKKAQGRVIYFRLGTISVVRPQIVRAQELPESGNPIWVPPAQFPFGVFQMRLYGLPAFKAAAPDVWIRAAMFCRQKPTFDKLPDPRLDRPR